MAKYAVTYQEILARTLIVEAEDYDEAADKMMDAVYRGEIELTPEDYVYESGEVVEVRRATIDDRHWYELI